MLAVCVQHEMDHLEGKLFVDYLSDLKRQRIRKKLDKDRKERAAKPRRSTSARCAARVLSPPPFPLRVAFAGTPAFSLPALRALVRSAHEVVGVLTQPDRPAGRGQQLAASPVKQAALAAGLPVAQPADARRPRTGAQTLRRLATGCAGGRGLRPDPAAGVLRLPRLGCLNIHASLLPRWRGAAPIQRAILAGDAETGVTIMQMDAGLDTGPMLLQAADAHRARDDTRRILHDGWRRWVRRRSSRRSTAWPTAAEAATAAREGVTYAAKLAKAEARIDWTRAPRKIDRQVRAFNPWPVAETRCDGEPVQLLRSAAEPDESTRLGRPAARHGPVGCPSARCSFSAAWAGSRCCKCSAPAAARSPRGNSPNAAPLAVPRRSVSLQ